MTATQSNLKKNSNAIASHFVIEVYVQDKWRTTYINTRCNVDDLMTKPLSWEKRWKFVQMLHQYVYPISS